MAISVRYPGAPQGVDFSGFERGLASLDEGLQERRTRKALDPYADWYETLLGGQGQQQPMSLASLAPRQEQPAPMDMPSQRVAQAHAASGGTPPQGAIEAYIRHAAQKRGIDPEIAIKVAMSEGGVTDPTRQSDVVKDGVREQSYGPFQLYMNGGLGNEAMAAGIDPRKDWQGGIDFALDKAKEGGWGPWYGAAKAGIGDMDGIGGPQAAMTGGGASQGVQMAQSAPQGSPGSMLPPPDVMRSLLGNKNTRAFGIAIAREAQKARQGDPEAALRLEKLRLEVDKLRSGGGDATEYGLSPIYGVDQDGNEGIGVLGKDGSFKRIDTGDDFRLSTGTGTVDLGTEIGTIDKRTGQIIAREPKQNFQENKDKAAGTEAGKREAELPILRSKAMSTMDSLDQQRGIVNDEIDRAIASIAESPNLTTGLVGGWSNAIPGTPAYALAKKLETIRANVGFDKLQSMRENSPTGGALGQVSDFENRQLQSVFGNLEQAQTADDIAYNLRRLKDLLAESRATRQQAFDRDFGGGQAATSGNRTSSGVQWSIEE